MSTESDKKNPGHGVGSWIATGLAIGTGMGVAIGIALDNLALGIAIGSGMGIAIGTTIEGHNRGEVSHVAGTSKQSRLALIAMLTGLMLLAAVLAALFVVAG